MEVRGIITSFTNGPGSGVADLDGKDSDGKDSDEEFWSKLDHREWDTPLSLQLVGVHCSEPVQHCRGSKPSRMMGLVAYGSKAGCGRCWFWEHGRRWELCDQEHVARRWLACLACRGELDRWAAILG